MAEIHKSETGPIPKWGLYPFPLLTVIFASIYLIKESFYLDLIKEDSIVEWLTFAFLIAAGMLSFIIAMKIKSKYNYLHWYFILCFGFNILAGMEEISWGQRVFEFETTGVFREYSDQNEMNLHNTFQGIFNIKTKYVALFVLFLYGNILPVLIQKRNQEQSNVLWRQLIIPPMFLRFGFTIASILMLDFQTGYEEEVGEFFFSICFFIMMLWNRILFKRGLFQGDNQVSISKRSPSLSV